jgi:hypothetical protein
MRTDKPKKLTTIITGGLGNQLFKIMSGIRIAEDLKRDLTVDISHYESDKINDGKLNIRKFELEYFPNLGQFKYQRFKSNFYTKNFNRLIKNMPISLRTKLGYFDDEIMYAGAPHRLAKILVGSFENIDFLPKIGRISELLAYPSLTTSWFEKLDERRQQEKPIAIHVRQGDYLNFPQNYNVLTPNYYRNGVEQLSSKLGTRKIWIFSDDPEKAKDWLGDSLRLFETEFIDAPEDISPGEVMRLMSLAEGIVTAHSTFSWWAAFIGWGNGTTKSVVIPEKYFADSSKLKNNLRVQNWIVLEV